MEGKSSGGLCPRETKRRSTATGNAVSTSIIGCPVSNGQPENTYAGNIIQIKKGVNYTFRNTYEHTHTVTERKRDRESERVRKGSAGTGESIDSSS